MFKLKSLAVVAAATLGSVSAFAVSLGNIPTGATTSIPASAVFNSGTPFSDTILFGSLAKANITIVLSSTATPGTTYFYPGGSVTAPGIGLMSFSAVLDGTTTLGSVTSGGITTLTLGQTLIAANSSHSLVISGEAIAGGQGTYNLGYITSTPVPEPETYALMLAGLGALGFIARRRKSV